MSKQTVKVLNNIKYNKIPEFAREYKREYQFIRGINKESKYVIFKIFDYQNDQNDQLFNSNTLNRFKNFIKRFLLGQEKGKLKDISDLVFSIEDLYNIKFIDKQFEFIRIQYDNLNDVENYYPCFIEFYNIFKKFFNQLKFYSFLIFDIIDLKLKNFEDDDDEYFNILIDLYPITDVNYYLNSRENYFK